MKHLLLIKNARKKCKKYYNLCGTKVLASYFIKFFEFLVINGSTVIRVDRSEGRFKKFLQNQQIILNNRLNHGVTIG